MRPSSEQITRARQIASKVLIEDGVYTLRRGTRKVVTDHYSATDRLLELWGIPEWSNDTCIAEMALDEALDRSER